jgi:hypothetical protein
MLHASDHSRPAQEDWSSISFIAREGNIVFGDGRCSAGSRSDLGNVNNRRLIVLIEMFDIAERAVERYEPFGINLLRFHFRFHCLGVVEWLL